MHHMMEKASTIWSKETGIDRNPADQVEVLRPDDARDRYLSEEELGRLKRALDEKMYRKGTNDLNKTNHRLRLIVLIAVIDRNACVGDIRASAGRTLCTAKVCWQ